VKRWWVSKGVGGWGWVGYLPKKNTKIKKKSRRFLVSLTFKEPSNVMPHLAVISHKKSSFKTKVY
jgi:hypothetical protein